MTILHHNKNDDFLLDYNNIISYLFLYQTFFGEPVLPFVDTDITAGAPNTYLPYRSCPNSYLVLPQLELTTHGERVRLIPALDGSLYQMNHKGLSPLPISSDTLLSSSYKMSHDTIFSGEYFLCPLYCSYGK